MNLDRWACNLLLQVQQKVAMGGSTERLSPDRNYALHLVDQVLAGGEGLLAMRGTHFDPQRGFADSDRPDPVHHVQGEDGPMPLHLEKDLLELVLGHALESLVFEPADCLALFSAAHQAHERDDRSGGG